MQEIPLNRWYGNPAHICMAADADGNIIEIENPYSPGRARVATMDDFYNDYLAFYLEGTLKQQIEQGILKPQKASAKVPTPMGASLMHNLLQAWKVVLRIKANSRRDPVCHNSRGAGANRAQ